MILIASFDVFDTVLTRVVGSPEAVFLVLGRRLFRMSLIRCTPEAFARARIEAERRAHRTAGDRCTLEMIHAELGVDLGLTEDQRHHLIEQECAMEAAMIRGVPGAIDRVQKARNLGRRVVFVSDMYLPSEFIREQLIRHGLWKDGDRCYVSCELGKSKRSGALFTEMLVQEEIAAQLAVHQGNSLEADIQPAALAGLHVDPFFDANLNRYEKLLEVHTWATEGMTSAMAGASRLARLSVPISSPSEAALRDVAAGVTAPTLVGFTLWLLQRAHQLGLTRLYFLSRDGQILLKAARQLAQAMGLSLELRYLFGSRQSWNLPAIITGSEEELAWIWDSTDFLSVKSLLNRVGIEPEQVQEQLRSAGLIRRDWVRALRPSERVSLQQVVQAEYVRALILQRAKDKRQILLQYLQQEGVLATTSWGLVDLGWYGSMQNALSAVLTEAGREPPVSFYFAIYKGEIVDKFAAQRETYYFDERLGVGYLDPVPNLIALMEMFCVADHGTVVDFAERVGRIEPLMKEASNERVISWGLPLVRQTIDCFIDNLLTDIDSVNPWTDVRDAITDVLRSFWLHPSKTEAKAWGAFPWEDGLGLETYWNRLARPYAREDVLKAIRARRIELHHRSSWFEGSLALSPLVIRIALINLVQVFRTYRSLSYRLNARLRTLKQP